MIRENILILHNIRSAHNVGSLFRTADCAGISHVFLTGYTPAPIDKFGKKVKEISKVSLGADDSVKWEKIKDLSKVLRVLKVRGFYIVAIEQNKSSVDYKKIEAPQKTVFILGNEVRGIDKKILANCDVVAEIPMNGSKESLNVSVAGGVVLFRILGV